jgi:3-oxoadipate enol-lactonase
VFTLPYESIGDLDIYYEIHGPSDAEPIIWISGWGNSYWLWFRQIPAFKDRYRCVVFDNRGVGRSSKPDFPYTMPMFADDTIGLMEALNIENAHIIGVSMGGPNIIPADNKTMTMMFASPTETISQDQALKMRYSVAYSPQFLLENKPLLKQIQEWTEQNPQPVTARLHQAAASISFNVEEEVKQISAPTLILQGSSDLMVLPKNAEMLADNISTSKLVLIDGGPHLSIFEHYDKINNTILNFLDEVEKGQFAPKPKKQVI